jgi:hypothetical protein
VQQLMLSVFRNISMDVRSYKSLVLPILLVNSLRLNTLSDLKLFLEVITFSPSGQNFLFGGRAFYSAVCR